MNAIVPHNFDELQLIAKAMASSKYFQDTNQEAQALVKVLAGREMGLGPFASMTGIHIIQGRPALGANLIASLIKNDPRYNYKVVKLDNTACSIDFYENGEMIGNSTFTLEDARKAQTKNLDKFPKNMLFARAISNGAKWYTPGIFGGSPVYTPEELGANTDEDGNIIEGQFVETTTVKTAAPATNGHSNGNGEKPPRYTPEALRDALTKSAGMHRANAVQITATDRNMIAVNLEACFAGDADSEHKRHVVLNYFFGVDSVKALDEGQVTAVKRWLAVTKDDDGEWRPNAEAVKEAKAVYRAALIAEGQQELIPA